MLSSNLCFGDYYAWLIYSLHLSKQCTEAIPTCYRVAIEATSQSEDRKQIRTDTQTQKDKIRIWASTQLQEKQIERTSRQGEKSHEASTDSNTQERHGISPSETKRTKTQLTKTSKQEKDMGFLPAEHGKGSKRHLKRPLSISTASSILLFLLPIRNVVYTVKPTPEVVSSRVWCLQGGLWRLRGFGLSGQGYNCPSLRLYNRASRSGASRSRASRGRASRSNTSASGTGTSGTRRRSG